MAQPLALVISALLCMVCNTVQNGGGDDGLLKDAPVDPAYAKLSAADRRLIEQQADDSYFTGSMSAQEKAFAEGQGSQEEMFGLSSKEKILARDQSRVWLDTKGKATLDYLTTPDSVSAADLGELASVRQTAAVNDAKLRKQLHDLKASTGNPTRTEQKNLQHTVDSLDHEIMYSEEEMSQDLGEGAEISASNSPENTAGNEKIEKAKSRAEAEMKTVNEKHQLEVTAYKAEMKELVEKADQGWMTAVQKAQQIVPNSLRTYDHEVEVRQAAGRKKSLDMKDAAEDEFRKVQAQMLQDRQNFTLHYTAESNKLISEQSKVVMDANGWYEKKLALLEDSKTKGVADAEQYMVKVRAESQQAIQTAKQESISQIQVTKANFERMESELKTRTDTNIQKMVEFVDESVAKAKTTFEEAKKKVDSAKELSHIEHTNAKKHADDVLAEARKDDDRVIEAKDHIMQIQMRSKEDESRQKSELKSQLENMEQEEYKFDLKVQQDRKEVKEKEKIRDQADAQRGDLSEEEYKKRQLQWLDTVKKDADKNCDDANNEANLRTRGARIANVRLSRMAADMLQMKQTVLEDIKVKSKKAVDMKEKASKKLKQVVADQAEAMKTSQLYDEEQVQKAAVEYSKVAGPAKEESVSIKEAEQKVEEAKENANAHSEDWAESQSLKTAKNLKDTAEAVCHKEKHRFEEVQYRVKERLGLAGEKDRENLMKGEVEAKKWAEQKVTVLLGQKKMLTEASEKQREKLTQEEERTQMQAEQSAKQAINEWKEKASKFEESSKQKQTQAESEFREDAAHQSVALREAEEVLSVSNNQYKQVQESMNHKVVHAKTVLLAEYQKEHQELIKRRDSSIEILQKSTGDDSQTGLERGEKHSREMLQKAGDQHKELIAKATEKRDDEIKAVNEKTKQEQEKLKAQLTEEQTEAEKRVANAKIIVSQKSSEADAIEKEASVHDEAARNTVELEAQTKAQNMLKNAQTIQQNTIKEAKEKFVVKVSQATDKETKEIHKIKQQIMASFQPARELEDTEDLVQIGESLTNNEDVFEVPPASAMLQIERMFTEQEQRLRLAAAAAIAKSV